MAKLDSIIHYAIAQQWLLGVVTGFLLARIGSWLDARKQTQRERGKLFNSYLDELNNHDEHAEFLLRAPDDLRSLDTSAWQEVKRSGELWAMDLETRGPITTYGEIVERYNYHLQEVQWLQRELLDHQNRQLVEYVTRTSLINRF